MNTLFKNAFIYTLGNVINKAFSFLLFPLIVRIFSKEDVGAIEMAWVFISFFVMLGTLQLDQGFARYYADEKYNLYKKEIFSTSLISITIFSIFLILLCLIIKNKCTLLLFNNLEYQKFFVITSLASFVNVINYFLLNVYKWQNKPKLFVAFTTLNLLINVVFIIFLKFFLNLEIIAFSISLLISYFLTSGISFYILKEEFILKLNKDLLKKLLKFSLPLLPYALSIVLLNYTDRFMINQYLDLSEVAIYSAGYKIASISTLFFTGFQHSWGPYVYSNFRKENAKNEFSKIFDIFTIIVSFMLIVITFLSPYLILILATKNYLEAYKVVPFLLLGLISYSLLYFGIGVGLSRKTYFNLVSSGIGIIANIGLNILLIPKFGIVGAAIATSLSYLLMALIKLYISQNLFYLPYKIKRNFCVILCTFLLIMLDSYFLNPFSYSYVILFPVMVIGLYYIQFWIYGFSVNNLIIKFRNTL